MDTPYSVGPQSARNLAQMLLRALAQAPLSDLADALGADDSTACRLRSGEARATVQQFAALVERVGMKFVPADSICVKKARFEAMAELLSGAMSDKDTARKLIWEGAQ